MTLAFVGIINNSYCLTDKSLSVLYFVLKLLTYNLAKSFLMVLKWYSKLRPSWMIRLVEQNNNIKNSNPTSPYSPVPS